MASSKLLVLSVASEGASNARRSLPGTCKVLSSQATLVGLLMANMWRTPVSLGCGKYVRPSSKAACIAPALSALAASDSTANEMFQAVGAHICRPVSRIVCLLTRADELPILDSLRGPSSKSD